MALHIFEDVYFVGGSVHDSYLIRLPFANVSDAVKRWKLEDGAQSVMPSTESVRRDDQIFCIAPIRDVILDETNKSSFYIASGQNGLGFVSNLHVS